MILQELVRLYDRLSSEQRSGSSAVPPYGYSSEKVSFCAVITDHGELVRIEDIRDQTGKKPRPVLMHVPEHTKRTVGVQPFFLCDNAIYLLGLDTKGKPERAAACHEATLELHQRAAAQTDEGSELRAAAAFLEDAPQLSEDQLLFSEELTAGANLVFRLDGVHHYVHQSDAAARVWGSLLAERLESAQSGSCLVTGEYAPLAVLHPPIKGIRGGQSTGTSLVSFNLDAFTSYGKDQGLNAPVSDVAAFKYVAALNHLTGSNERKVMIGDATTVYWAERASRFENVFGFAFGGDSDDESSQHVRSQLLRLRDGKPLSEVDPEISFYVLGLAPNAARASVRFWLKDTVGAFAQHLAQHLQDCGIERQFDSEPETIPIWRFVKESARRYVGSGRDRKVIDMDPNPTIVAAVARSILSGSDYPAGMLSAVVRRARSDGEINYVRMAALKAVITRFRRRNGRKEVPMALDRENDSIGYQLGRLFAALERAQRAALGEVNATVKDRYYGAASSTPGRVFPILMRLSQHHIAKAQWGAAVDRIIGDVVDRIGAFPAYLSLEEQGLFAIGYYHQRNDFFRKKDKEEEQNG